MKLAPILSVDSVQLLGRWLCSSFCQHVLRHVQVKDGAPSLLIAFSAEQHAKQVVVEAYLASVHRGGLAAAPSCPEEVPQKTWEQRAWNKIKSLRPNCSKKFCCSGVAVL